MTHPPAAFTPATMDPVALARLGTERLDWRFKSVPDTLIGLTAAEAAAGRVDLFGAGFLGPIAVIDGAALEHNLATMAGWCAGRGLAIAPHGKTTMAPALFARQIAHGAWAITAATIGQARVYRAFGVSRIVLANELVDPAGLAWLARELADPAFEFVCWADSVRAVELMSAGWTGPRPIDVMVEVGVTGGRTGVRDLDTARDVAAAVVASPAVRLVGVGGYEGPAATDASTDGLTAVAAYLDRLRDTVFALADAFETERVIVSAGGSAYFDQVADALTGVFPVDVLPVLRCGTYLTHDDGFYRDVSPLGEHQRLDAAARLRPALTVWAQVLSCPEPGLALLGVGKRDVPFDLGLPVPRTRRTAHGVAPLSGGVITALNDQHAFLRGSDVEIGDWIGLGVSHPCTTFDKWGLLPLTDGETVVEFVRTFF